MGTRLPTLDPPRESSLTVSMVSVKLIRRAMMVRTVPSRNLLPQAACSGTPLNRLLGPLLLLQLLLPRPLRRLEDCSPFRNPLNPPLVTRTRPRRLLGALRRLRLEDCSVSVRKRIRLLLRESKLEEDVLEEKLKRVSVVVRLPLRQSLRPRLLRATCLLGSELLLRKIKRLLMLLLRKLCTQDVK